MTSPYLIGQEDHAAGLPSTENPYTPSVQASQLDHDQTSHNRMAWFRGWHDANLGIVNRVTVEATIWKAAMTSLRLGSQNVAFNTEATAAARNARAHFASAQQHAISLCSK